MPMSQFMTDWCFIYNGLNAVKGHFWYSQLHPDSPSSINTTVQIGREVEYPVFKRAREADEQLAKMMLAIR